MILIRLFFYIFLEGLGIDTLFPVLDTEIASEIHY
jgi:hypothetical protein